jgi:peptidoglycan/LPS O-acetylase OafA/YrhL
MPLETQPITLQSDDSSFLKHLRALSIFVIVFGHVGGFWVFTPYSQYLLTFNAVFFFIGGAVAPSTFSKSSSIKPYLFNRVITLYVPYLILCFIALMYFFFEQHRLPHFSLTGFLGWLTMYPSNQYMPFPLGQLWFLQAFLIVSLVSPFLLRIQRNKMVKYFYLIFILLVSLLIFLNKKLVGALFFNERIYFPIFYSYMYFLGNHYGMNSAPFKKKWGVVIGPVIVLLAYISVQVAGSTPFYTEHVFPPDVYFLLGSTAIILFITSLQRYILAFINTFKILTLFSDFFFRHTFSIFLTHTLAINLVELTFFSIFPMQKNFLYGIIKIFLVLTLTALISIPFTQAANKTISLLKSKATIR